MHRMCGCVVAIASFNLSFNNARAQAPRPTFAAASIKLKPNATFGRVEFKPGGRLTAVNASVYQLLQAAYGINVPGQLRKGPNCPSWIDSERFDVEAISEEGAIPEHLDNGQLRERMQVRLQGLLAERFNLVVQHEWAELSVYTLTPAKAGPKLKEASVSEGECRSSSDCHRLQGSPTQGLRGTSVSIADLASVLGALTDRPVVDATGIAGLFVLQLGPFAHPRAFLDDFVESLPPDQRPPPEPPKPSLSSVLEKDLGLLLVAARSRIEILQIVSINRPTPN